MCPLPLTRVVSRAFSESWSLPATGYSTAHTPNGERSAFDDRTQDRGSPKPAGEGEAVVAMDEPQARGQGGLGLERRLR